MPQLIQVVFSTKDRNAWIHAGIEAEVGLVQVDEGGVLEDQWNPHG